METIVRKRSAVLLSGILGSFLLLGCTSTSVSRELPGPGERLLWSTHSQRPAWCADGRLETEGDRVQFLTVSDKYTTERYAREDAEQASRKKAVRYTGNLVRASIQNIVDQEGRATDTLNPERAQREFEHQLTLGGISQLAAVSWHLEKWLDDRGKVYWKAFLLSEIPRDELDRAIAAFVKTEEARLRRFAEESADDGFAVPGN